MTLCSCIGPCDSVFGLMFCCYCLEILNNFLKNYYFFHFSLEPSNLASPICINNLTSTEVFLDFLVRHFMRNRPSEDNPNGTGDSFNGKGKHFEEVESVRQKIIMDFEETMESFHSQDVELKSQCKKAAL